MIAGKQKYAIYEWYAKVVMLYENCLWPGSVG